MKRLLTSAVLVIMLIGGSVGYVGAYTIDNLGFLFNTGDTQSSSVDFKAGVTELASSPFSTGLYSAIYLGFEAEHRNYLKDSGAPVFGNLGVSTPGDNAVINVAASFFDDTIDGPHDVSLTAMTNLKMFTVSGSYLNDYTESSWFAANDNYHVIGFNDGSPVDADYDDLVVAVKANPVPIPGAIWLLGSGLLGLLGIRRRKA
ncbi:MAG: hypothetical protein JXR80_02680 [Deltaproteobacteria bacterium]|nr:hypothetical protein [Deltaproteobacteria bacterium]